MYQSEAGTLPVTTGHRNHPGITHTPNSLGHRRSACHRINRYRLGVLGWRHSRGPAEVTFTRPPTAGLRPGPPISRFPYPPDSDSGIVRLTSPAAAA